MDKTPKHDAEVVLALGGNVGDVSATMQRALEAMGNLEETRVISVSSQYRTEPRDVTDAQDWYINAAAIIATRLDPETLRRRLEAIEISLGRRSKSDLQPRSIDIDIIDYDGVIMHTPKLTLPHPRMHVRRFVLTPLAEIAPGWLHPLLQLTAVQLLARCPDTGAVHPVNN